MADDHVFFIPRRIRLSICGRNITLPRMRLFYCTQEAAEDAVSMADDPIVDIDSSAFRDDGE